jgi:hypothetical protein
MIKFGQVLKDWQKKELEDRRNWCKLQGRNCEDCKVMTCENNSKEEKDEI